mgnify:CR=1 FL=1
MPGFRTFFMGSLLGASIIFSGILSGCSTTKNTNRAIEVGDFGCRFVPVAGSLCKKGLQKLASEQQNNMYRVLGETALNMPIGQVTPWRFRKDTGVLVVTSRSGGRVEGIGAFHIMEISYLYLTNNKIERGNTVTLVAVENPDKDKENAPDFVYIWQ